MKLKNRSYLFLVVRQPKGSEQQLPIAAFYSLESAEEYAGVCLQEFLEKGTEEYLFNVLTVIYYDQ